MMFGRVIRLYVGNFTQANIQMVYKVDEKRNRTAQAQTVFTDGMFKDLSDLHVSFEVKRSIEFYENKAEITIYNPAKETFEYVIGGSANSVILQAGYESEDNVSNIFVGQISFARGERRGSDFILLITCVSARGAFYQLARLIVSFTFDKGTTFKQCLEYLCNYAGIALRSGYSDKLNKTLESSFSFSGIFTDCVRSFNYGYLNPATGLHVILDNNEMIIADSKDSASAVIYKLDYTSGLLNCVKQRDESHNIINLGEDPVYYMSSKSVQDESEAVKAREIKEAQEFPRNLTIQFQALLNPQITPNSIVDIDSSNDDEADSVFAIKGRFVITEVVYRGSNFESDFTINCDAEEWKGA